MELKKRQREIEALTDRFYALGADGWELVSYGAGVVPSSLTSVGLCFFKRRVGEQS